MHTSYQKKFISSTAQEEHIRKTFSTWHGLAFAHTAALGAGGDAPSPTFPYSAQPVCGLPGQQMGDDVGLRVRLIAAAAALPVRRGMAGIRVA